MPERDDLQTGNGTSSVVGSRQWRQVLRDVDEVVAGCILMIYGGGTMVREKRFKSRKGHRVVSKDKKWVKTK